MSTAEMHLALLSAGPRHGYEVKKEHDAWFPGARPLAFGQVYATLGRLVRDGLAEVVETRTGAGPERTVYAVTDAGRARLRAWLEEPSAPAATGGEELVRRTVAALRTATSTADVRDLVVRQRSAHLRLMRELRDADRAARDGGAGGGGADGGGAGRDGGVRGDGGEEDLGARVSRRHALLHLDADLRWLDETVETLTGQRPPLSSAPLPSETAPRETRS